VIGFVQCVFDTFLVDGSVNYSDSDSSLADTPKPDEFVITYPLFGARVYNGGGDI
jgi:hypothetical protein